MFVLGGVRNRYLALLGVSFAIVIALGYWILDRERQARLSLVAEQLGQSARLISITQRGLVGASEKLLRDIALDGDVVRRGRPVADCHQTLRRYLSGNPEFRNVGVLDRDGRVACMGLPADRPEIDFAHLPFVARAMSGDAMVISDVQTSPVTGMPTLYFARRGDIGSEARQTVFFAALDLDWLNSQLAEYVTLQAGNLALVDGNGQELARFRAEAGPAQAAPAIVRTDVDLFSRLLGVGEVGTAISAQPDGRDKLVGFAHFARTVSGPAYLLVSVDKAQALAPAMRAVYLQMALVAACLTVVWAAMFIGGGRLFIARINTLFDATRRVAGGNLATRVDVVSNHDELDGLAHAFNDMTETLQAQQESLVRLNANLNRTNRSLKVLSSGNRALLDCKSREDLVDRVCGKVVGVGSYPLAAVVRFGPSADRLFAAEVAVPMEYHGEPVKPIFEALSGPAAADVLAGLRQSVSQRIICTDEDKPGGLVELCRFGELHELVFLPLSDNHHVNGSLIIGSADPQGFLAEELRYLEETARDLSFGLRSLQVAAEHSELKDLSRDFQRTLRASLEEALAAISAALEMRDPYTAGHERRVADLSEAIAVRLGLGEEEAHAIYLAGIVHDIGKMKVPAEILVKPSRLSDLEFQLIKEHATAGYEILRTIKFPWPIAEMVHQHHERIDGSGYPKALVGGSILFGARILAVADVVESMASHRPYRPSLGILAAIEEIRKGAGVRYDEQVVAACVAIFEDRDFEWPV